jgi:hypothetical protein
MPLLLCGGAGAVTDTLVMTMKETSTFGGRLVLALAFGAAFGIAIAVCFATLSWWQRRPRPWVAAAITASVRDLRRQDDNRGAPQSMIVNVTLTNHTNSDYRLDGNSMTVALRRGTALHLAKGVAVEGPIFVPAGERADARILIPISALFDMVSTRKTFRALGADLTPVTGDIFDRIAAEEGKSEHQIAVELMPDEISGIALFDQTNHYAINVPKAW